MNRILSRSLAFLLLIAYAATSVGPRGAALCLGGGHGLDEIIAQHCEHGGHSHGGGDDHHHDQASNCAGCAHHHHEQHGPCTDIPLDADEARPSVNSGHAKIVADIALDMVTPSAWLKPVRQVTMFARPQPPNTDVERAPRQVTASLRAVILLI